MRRAVAAGGLVVAAAVAAGWLKSSRSVREPEPSSETRFHLERMEAADRQRWEPSSPIVAALRLAGTEQLADLGAGSGYLAVQFARALPRGSVVATEINPELVAFLRHRVAEEGLHNVEVARVAADDPGIPPGTDVAVVVNVLHLVHGRMDWLRKVHAQLEPGGRLLVVQFDETKPLEGVPQGIMAPKERLVSRVREVGFVLREDLSDSMPHQMLLVFERPAAVPASR